MSFATLPDVSLRSTYLKTLNMKNKLSLIKCFSACIVSTLILLKNVDAVPFSKEVTLSKHPVILVVSYDGFRADYMNKVKTPTLDALRKEGVYVPYMQPVFPTKTFPNHQSIATGLYAESHGIVDNTFFDPKYNETLSGFEDTPGFWNYQEDVLPLWLHNEMAGDGRISGALMWPGSSQPYGKDNNMLPTYYYPGYNGSVPWENRVETVVSWITDEKKPANLVFLYYDEPDTKGHAFGPNDPVTLEEVEKADNRTAYLVQKFKDAGIFDKINLVILSDHGMAGVTQERIVNLDSLLNRDLIQAIYGQSPIIQLVPKEGKQEELYNSLLDHSFTNHFTVWKKGELQQPYHYSSSRRVLNITLLAEPEYAFDDLQVKINAYNKNWNLTANASREYGVHGYNNMHASMRPIFLARGPAFNKGFEYAPIKNVDIVPLISNILQIPEPPNNGSLKSVVAMIHPDFLKSSGNNVQVQLSYMSIVLLAIQFRFHISA